MKFDLSLHKIDNVLFKCKAGPYGLNILILFEDNSVLFFDSTEFIYFKDKSNIEDIPSYSEVKNVSYLIESFIVNVKEEELTNYFLLFSNGSILHIYQKIYDLEYWEQDYIVEGFNEGNYFEIVNYMNEDWVEECNIKTSPLT